MCILQCHHSSEQYFLSIFSTAIPPLQTDAYKEFAVCLSNHADLEKKQQELFKK